MPVIVEVRIRIPPAANNNSERRTAVINAAPRSSARLSQDLFDVMILVTPEICIAQSDV